ncbi:biotin-protein ligase [Syncephalis fuscata]|nr:biotin-protein ligase [Syncephalis fuscata]
MPLFVPWTRTCFLAIASCSLMLLLRLWNANAALLSSRLSSSSSSMYNHTLSPVNVLVYDGPGVSPHCLHQTLRTLRAVLGTRYSVQQVSADALSREPWESTAALLVMPGGRDKPYQEKLHPQANKRIRAYVEEGGRYLGLCAGGYYAGATVEFELGTPLEVNEKRDLQFFPGVVRGCVYPGFVYDSEAGARAVPIQLNTTIANTITQSTNNSESIYIYYNGGGAFIDADETPNIQVLARYPEGQASIITSQVGRGKALLTGIHPEFDATLLNENDPVYSDKTLVLKLRASNSARLLLFRYLLEEVGLTTYISDPILPPLTPLWLTSFASATINSVKQRLETAKDANTNVINGENDRFVIYNDYKSLVHSLIISPSFNASSSNAITPPGPFSLASYYKHWQSARSLVDQLRPNAFGATVIYTETITSTQTLLEKNDRLSRHLPDGTVCVATRQVSGRGRGRNAWVSPTGSLSFSMILRQELNNNLPSPVLVQYLVGLAVVDGIRSRPGYESSTMDKYVKMGGILVNSSFQSNQFTLVIGCGLNANQTNLAPFTLEEILALIVTRLEHFYKIFIHSGFSSLLDLYYRYWLHTGKIVTLKDQSGIVVRIQGITPDYGLLETVAIDEHIYTLQPDGNSFDMMQNMISNKR